MGGGAGLAQVSAVGSGEEVSQLRAEAAVLNPRGNSSGGSKVLRTPEPQAQPSTMAASSGKEALGSGWGSIWQDQLEMSHCRSSEDTQGAAESSASPPLALASPHLSSHSLRAEAPRPVWELTCLTSEGFT